MSIESWRKEFMPVPASRCPEGEEARFDLRRWRGLTRRNLARHELENDHAFRHSVARFSHSALCLRYRDWDGSDECRNCPLALSRGGTPCWEESERERGGYRSPWDYWRIDAEPQGMIDALEELA